MSNLAAFPFGARENNLNTITFLFEMGHRATISSAMRNLYSSGMIKTDDTSEVGRDSDKFQVRLPDGMRRELFLMSKKNGRSMNAEIVSRLQSSFTNDPALVLSVIGSHVGLVRLMAECLEELAQLAPPDPAVAEKVEVLLRLGRAVTNKGVGNAQ